MTISSTTNRVEYIGNAATSIYSYTFRILDDDDLLVTVASDASPPVETTLTKTTDYTVTGVGDAGGGTIVLVNASQAWLTSGNLKSGYALVIRRVRTLTQETDIRNQGDFYPETHEDTFDHLVMIDQQQQDELDRSVKLPESVTASDFDTTLPTDIATAARALVTNADGDGFDIGPTTDDISNAQTYANNSATSASASAASATASATSATASAASATAAAASATAAATSATNAATSATAAQTAETNAETAETNAEIAETNAETAETNAAASASAAATSATASATSATASAGSATTASTQASNAATSASASATSAAASATSAAEALASESAAATSATNAANSASTAAAAVTAHEADTTSIHGIEDTAALYRAGGTDVPIDDGGTGASTKTAAYNALSPATTAGDLSVFDGTNNIRLPIGTDGQIPLVDSSLAHKIKWATLPQGNKNYINYNNFENNATTGWSLGTATLTNALPSGVPTFDSGASGNLSIAAVSSGKLAGSYSLSLVSSAATTAGNFLASQAYTIDIADQAKVLAFKAYYSATVNPSNANWSGTSSNSFGIAIYDVTNSAWIIPTGCFNLVQSSGVGIAQGTFQTPSNMTEFRIVVFNANATSGAITMLLDDFYVGPQALAFGPPITDWTAFNPTGSWSSNTTYTGFWRRVGDSMELDVKIAVSGAPTSANLTVNLPFGSIDTAKLSGATVNGTQLGSGTAVDAGVNTWQVFANYSTTTALALFHDNGAGTESNVTQAAPFTFASGDLVQFKATIPITGWGANTAMSADSDTRICAAASLSTPTSAAFNDSAYIKFPTMAFDTHSGYSASTGLYTAQVNGPHHFSGQFGITGSSAGSYCDLNIYINGVSTHTFNTANLVTGENFVAFNRTLNLVAGQTVGFRWSTDKSSAAVSGGTNKNNLSIFKMSGPAVIAASENINAHFTAASNVITTGNTNVITGLTKVYDSHGWMNTTTGVYTVGSPCKLRISAYANGASVAYTAGSNRYVAVKLTGTKTKYIGLIPISASFTSYLAVPGSITDSFLPGDTISISIENGSGSTFTLEASGSFITIEKVD